MTHVSGGRSRPLRLVMDLCDALARDDIGYCHWKSTDALDRSSTGENDLDLLIAEQDVARFETTLRGLGFIEALVRPSRRLLGVRHFYGLDAPTGRLVDVHAHERLVLGDDATKNYRLPIEGAYIATAEQAGAFMVPSPELEFAVFIVRMMLKHGSPEAIATGRGALSDRERKELRHLSALSGAGGEWQLLRHSAPMLPGSVLERCVTTFEPDADLRVRLRVWRELSHHLAPFAARSRPADAWLQLWRRLEGRTRSTSSGAHQGNN